MKLKLYEYLLKWKVYFIKRTGKHDIVFKTPALFKFYLYKLMID